MSLVYLALHRWRRVATWNPDRQLEYCRRRVAFTVIGPPVMTDFQHLSFSSLHYNRLPSLSPLLHNYRVRLTTIRTGGGQTAH